MLNENEMNVLKELYQSSKGNGHDFGFTDEIDYRKIGISLKQISGYISQLSQKGYIIVYPREKDLVQFELTEKFWNQNFKWVTK